MSRKRIHFLNKDIELKYFLSAIVLIVILMTLYLLKILGNSKHSNQLTESVPTFEKKQLKAVDALDELADQLGGQKADFSEFAPMIDNDQPNTLEEKGDEFENFTIDKFNWNYFSLEDERSKGSNGIFPKFNQYPDLLLKYKPKSIQFAVECKWRKGWNENFNDNTKTSKEKGDEFENFTIGKFNWNYFSLEDMRSDKGSNGIFPKSNQYPDLLLKYKPESIQFAVECKWRKGWNKNSKKGKYYLNWTGGDNKKGESKIRTYQRYSREYNVPVFIVIGVMGTPSNPEELFVVPLNDLKFPKVEKNYLEIYRKKNQNVNFYFDHKNKILS